MQFQVKALRESTEVEWVMLDAADESEAIRQAESRGYRVLAAKAGSGSWLGGVLRRRSFPLLLFSEELLVLLKAGLPLTDALDSLGERERNAQAKAVLDQLRARLQEGLPLSAALQSEPAAFPPLYVATVRASERTGDLVEALSRFVSYQTRLDKVRNKLLSASIYPALLVGAGGLVTLFLMFYVVPRFSRIYEDLGSKLPTFSVWLLDWGRFIEGYGAGVAAALAVVAAAVFLWLRTPAARRRVEGALWRVPAIGERMRIYHLSRFYRMVGMLLRSGMPAVPALQMASGLLHPVLRVPVAAAWKSISEGRAASESLERHGMTTPIALRMRVVGERSGALGAMMEQIAVFHDEEVSRWVDWFTRLFEPLLMAFIGLVIGGIVVLMYMPIFELAGSIQ